MCVKFNEEHIPGSPFPITASGVGSKPQQILSDASKARAFGSGLRRATVGSNNFTVDCTEAGECTLARFSE